jgi:ElaB/YqjD/DUF883 family membrane-anchored ribosome-binding protein
MNELGLQVQPRVDDQDLLNRAVALERAQEVRVEREQAQDQARETVQSQERFAKLRVIHAVRTREADQARSIWKWLAFAAGIGFLIGYGDGRREQRRERLGRDSQRGGTGPGQSDAAEPVAGRAG